MTEETIVNKDNVRDVKRLRDRGVSWSKIGKMIADKRGRPSTYQAASTHNSYKNFKRRRRKKR